MAFQPFRWFAVGVFLGGFSAVPALSQDIAAAGRHRAEGSKTEWEIRDARHPALGDIRYAYMKNLHVTPVGSAKVYSRAYVSCVKANRRVAIELTNTQAPDDPGGMHPAARPRILCGRPAPGGKLAYDEILAPFDIDSKTGDALAKGLSASELRQCLALTAIQEVALPAGWTRKSARVEFEFLPYSRALDTVFATCGERTAYAQPAAAPTAAPARPATTSAAKTPPPAATVAAAPPPAAMAAAAPPPAKTTPPPPTKATAPVKSADGWITARVIFGGRTNVRENPNTNATIVTRVDPGDFVLVQKTGNEWYRARSARGAAWEGYIREDRLAIK